MNSTMYKNAVRPLDAFVSFHMIKWLPSNARLQSCGAAHVVSLNIIFVYTFGVRIKIGVYVVLILGLGVACFLVTRQAGFRSVQMH